jgi:WD40-like Beta Propeller Repeat
MKLLRSTACALILLLVAGSNHAQVYFGKNKVQYTRFDWQVMSTEHFKVYFYPEAAEIARIAAQLAEDSYRELAPKFNHEVKREIPLIIYSTPSYFSQTNVSSGLLPESVGGFTEFLKGRVVVPFNGNYHDFDHVIRHELVHVFMLDILDVNLSKRSKIKFAYPPLWFTEGIAEFWSKPWDAEADMIIKDMVLSGKLPTINDFYMYQGSYFMYKLGEAVCHFIDSTYGPDKLTSIWEDWHKGRNFGEVVSTTLGDDLNELSRKWHYSLRKKYFPQIDTLDLPEQVATRLTNGGFAVRGVPIRWDDGNGAKDWIVYKANRLGYSGIYMSPATKQGQPVKTLLKGERSSDFESLYLLRSGIDADNRGQIVFSSKSKENDVLYLYDLHKGGVVRRYEFDNLVNVRSPKLSPDGTHAVFCGNGKDGVSDLYLVQLQTGELNRLTNDFFDDIDPTFTGDGASVVFSSNRCTGGSSGAKNLFRLTITDKQITQLTLGEYRDAAPSYHDSVCYFSSDRGGTYNICTLQPNGQIAIISSWATGAFEPRVTPDGKNITFTGYQNQRFQIYSTALTDSSRPSVPDSASIKPMWSASTIKTEVSQGSVKYRTDYSFDIAQSSIGYDPVYGSLGGLQVAMSDMLGNRAFHFLLTNTGKTKDDFLKSINGGVTYINRQRRLNWGIGGFHLYDEYFNDFDLYFYEREAGAIVLLSYPISKFMRIDFTSLARYSSRELRNGLPPRNAFLGSGYMSFVFDNSLWDISGPIEGRRYNFTVGTTQAVDLGENFSRLAIADIRHYFRLGANSAFANRLFGYTSTGKEPERIYFGGSWSFRGYDRRQFYKRKIAFMSNELRFPLIDNLNIGFPFGPLQFQSIRGALFLDLGSAWDEEFPGWLGSFGGGFRVPLGYYVLLRFDFTRTFDEYELSPRTDFDFFFGWNF